MTNEEVQLQLYDLKKIKELSLPPFFPSKYWFISNPCIILFHLLGFWYNYIFLFYMYICYCIYGCFQQKLKTSLLYINNLFLFHFLSAKECNQSRPPARQIFSTWWQHISILWHKMVTVCQMDRLFCQVLYKRKRKMLFWDTAGTKAEQDWVCFPLIFFLISQCKNGLNSLHKIDSIESQLLDQPHTIVHWGRCWPGVWGNILL